MSDFNLEVITPKQPVVAYALARGWGKEATLTLVEGFPMSITIVRDGDPQITFRILEDGEIIITDHGHLCYTRRASMNERLYPERPWVEEKKKKKKPRQTGRGAAK